MHVAWCCHDNLAAVQGAQGGSASYSAVQASRVGGGAGGVGYKGSGPWAADWTSVQGYVADTLCDEQSPTVWEMLKNARVRSGRMVEECSIKHPCRCGAPAMPCAGSELHKHLGKWHVAAELV